MKTSQIARGGMLTGIAVVLLYLACVVPPARGAFCTAAGLVVAVPLALGWVRMGVLVYLASGLLALLLLPQKKYAVCHLILTGLYPLVKFAAERTGRLVWEIAVKAAFAAAVGAAMLLCASAGFLPGLASKMQDMAWYWLLLPYIAAFAVVDIAMSRVIAGIRVLLKK